MSLLKQYRDRIVEIISRSQTYHRTLNSLHKRYLHYDIVKQNMYTCTYIVYII
jgi:hypothetical protein